MDPFLSIQKVNSAYCLMYPWSGIFRLYIRSGIPSHGVLILRIGSSELILNPTSYEWYTSAFGVKTGEVGTDRIWVPELLAFACGPIVRSNVLKATVTFMAPLAHLFRSACVCHPTDISPPVISTELTVSLYAFTMEVFGVGTSCALGSRAIGILQHSNSAT